MTLQLRWLRGDEAARRAVERWREGSLPGEVLRQNERRRLVRLRDPEAGELLVKHFRLGTGRHRLREAWKARLGRSGPDREHRALAHLAARGVAVPAPRGLAELPDGDRLLVLEFVAGVPLAEVLARPRPERSRALAALGREVAGLHAAGLVHGDLHGENLLFAARGPVILDLQHARRRRGEAGRARDLGELDYSLWRRASLADRVRVRAAALGLARPFDPAARRTLRRVGDAAARRAHQHGRSRTRRSLQPGRLYAALALGGARGLRVRDVPAETVAAALAGHAEALAAGDARVLTDDGRSRITDVRAGAQRVVVKQVLPRGPARALADTFRGSSARRAWRAGHGLLARGIGAARPLAFLERRRAGIPVGSWLVLEHTDPALDALAAAARDPDATLEALRRLVDALHRRAVVHGDLKASHVFLDLRESPPRAQLIDLESVRFCRRLSSARRLADLAELNASLPDAVPAAPRRLAFDRYRAVHRFAEGRAAALRTLVRLSLARRHRWTGRGCACAESGEAGAGRARGGGGAGVSDSARR